VLACFGSATQHAQMFEEALGNFLLAYNHIRPKKLTAEAFEELKQNIHGRTMGNCCMNLGRWSSSMTGMIPRNEWKPRYMCGII
jgi:hypothetical protein